ncbi:hypothetical protein Bca101_060802 [Brassica carinata]
MDVFHSPSDDEYDVDLAVEYTDGKEDVENFSEQIDDPVFEEYHEHDALCGYPILEDDFIDQFGDGVFDAKKPPIFDVMTQKAMATLVSIKSVIQFFDLIAKDVSEVGPISNIFETDELEQITIEKVGEESESFIDAVYAHKTPSYGVDAFLRQSFGHFNLVCGRLFQQEKEENSNEDHSVKWDPSFSISVEFAADLIHSRGRMDMHGKFDKDQVIILDMSTVFQVVTDIHMTTLYTLCCFIGGELEHQKSLCHHHLCYGLIIQDIKFYVSEMLAQQGAIFSHRQHCLMCWQKYVDLCKLVKPLLVDDTMLKCMRLCVSLLPFSAERIWKTSIDNEKSNIYSFNVDGHCIVLFPKPTLPLSPLPLGVISPRQMTEESCASNTVMWCSQSTIHNIFHLEEHGLSTVVALKWDDHQVKRHHKCIYMKYIVKAVFMLRQKLIVTSVVVNVRDPSYEYAQVIAFCGDIIKKIMKSSLSVVWVLFFRKWDVLSSICGGSFYGENIVQQELTFVFHLDGLKGTVMCLIAPPGGIFPSLVVMDFSDTRLYFEELDYLLVLLSDCLALKIYTARRILVHITRWDFQDMSDASICWFEMLAKVDMIGAQLRSMGDMRSYLLAQLRNNDKEKF